MEGSPSFISCFKLFSPFSGGALKWVQDPPRHLSIHRQPWPESPWWMCGIRMNMERNQDCDEYGKKSGFWWIWKEIRIMMNVERNLCLSALACLSGQSWGAVGEAVNSCQHRAGKGLARNNREPWNCICFYCKSEQLLGTWLILK